MARGFGPARHRPELRDSGEAGVKGCHGVVCSGLKVATISRELGPELIAVTPGIRPAWSIMAAILICLTTETRCRQMIGERQ